MSGMHVRSHALFVLALLGAGSAACNDVLVATFVESGAGDAMPTQCGALDGGFGSCPDGSFCSMASCGTSAGTCDVIPSRETCADAGYDPECGCNGVNYFNSCLRRAARISYAGPKESCDPNPTQHQPPCSLKDALSKCDPPQSCVLVLPPQFNEIAGGMLCPTFVDMLPIGTCWELPDKCPPSTGGGLRSCSPTCVDACEALKDGGVFFSCSP